MHVGKSKKEHSKLQWNPEELVGVERDRIDFVSTFFNWTFNRMKQQ